MASIELEQIVGPATRADGLVDGPTRVSRTNAAVNTQAHGRYYEASARGNLYTLILTAVTTALSGNFVGAGAATATQFGLINPANSNKNLVLMKFEVGLTTAAAAPPGPVFHGYIPNAASITAASPGGTIRSNILGNVGNSVAVPWVSAAGSALTGGQAPVTHRCADFASTATAQGTVGEIRIVEYVDGDLIVPPGIMWLPLWGSLGNAVIPGYSVTWEEVSV